MKFKLDENIPGEVSILLARAGHDVQTVVSENLGGARDPMVLAACVEEGRALVTMDLDFSDIRTYPPEDSHGIIVIRPARQSTFRVVEALRGSMKYLETEPLVGQLWIVEDSRVRISGAGPRA